MPAYQRLRAFIASDYLPACRDTVSLSALPDGEAWYAFNVKQQTTTDLSPAQIHQIGLDEVARIQGERSEEHTSELQSLMRISYAVFCLKKKKFPPHSLHTLLHN